MDILRAALGEEKLHYLGKSYGTYLGTTYADLFPSKVGRFVLDGVVAPDLTAEEINLGQARGLRGSHPRVGCVLRRGGGLPARDRPSTRSCRGCVTSCSRWTATRCRHRRRRRSPAHRGLGLLGIANAAMYDQGQWRTLVDSMSEALKGDGTSLMQLANQYADRNPGGQYAGNIMEVIYAVNCLDKPETERRGRAGPPGSGVGGGRAHVGAVPHVEFAAVRVLADRAHR
jgi:pimeloyl-ACP methyl ester carboxylesterase